MTGKRIIVDTTNPGTGDEFGTFEEIDRDAPKSAVSIPSAQFKRNYDRIDWSKKDESKASD